MYYRNVYPYTHAHVIKHAHTHTHARTHARTHAHTHSHTHKVPQRRTKTAGMTMTIIYDDQKGDYYLGGTAVPLLGFPVAFSEIKTKRVK